MFNKFKLWLSTPPKKEDLFFVHIRETYQIIKRWRSYVIQTARKF